LAGGSILVLCTAFAACTSTTNVSLSGNLPAQYTHMWLTVQGVWFNTSATATPDDTTWVKFPLTTPVTLDLVTGATGTLGQIATGLKLTAGTYAQVRVIPVDASATLTSSAQTAGALFNAEADYVDSAGTTHRVPLELPNPDKGIGIQTSITIPVGTSATTTSSTTTPSTSSTSSATTVSTVVNVDGASDLAVFTYGSTLTGVLLSSHATGYDLSTVGSIQGTLSLTNLTGTTITNASGRMAIEVTAESLSSDGTRHIVVSSAQVQSDGTFTLYPLASSSSSPRNTTSSFTDRA